MPKVILNAKFPGMKPAHDAFIQKTGSGSNLDRAVRDGVQELFKDKRLKGKRKQDILPFTLTIVGVEESGGEGDK